MGRWSTASIGSGGVECDDWASQKVRCYQWTGISQTCSRRIVDIVAEHFHKHRFYALFAFWRSNNEQDRLGQECKEAFGPTGKYADAENWLKSCEKKPAVCWDFTLTF